MKDNNLAKAHLTKKMRKMRFIFIRLEKMVMRLAPNMIVIIIIRLGLGLKLERLLKLL